MPRREPGRPSRNLRCWLLVSGGPPLRAVPVPSRPVPQVRSGALPVWGARSGAGGAGTGTIGGRRHRYRRGELPRCSRRGRAHGTPAAPGAARRRCGERKRPAPAALFLTNYPSPGPGKIYGPGGRAGARARPRGVRAAQRRAQGSLCRCRRAPAAHPAPTGRADTPANSCLPPVPKSAPEEPGPGTPTGGEELEPESPTGAEEPLFSAEHRGRFRWRGGEPAGWGPPEHEE